MDLYKRILGLNLPRGQYVVMGSAILEVKGIRKAGDLDIIVTENLFSKLRLEDNDWRYTEEWGDVGGGMNVESLEGPGNVSLYKWIYGGGTIDFFLEDPANIEKINDVIFVSLQNLLAIKSSSWDRPKDKNDVELIQKYLYTKKSLRST